MPQASLPTRPDPISPLPSPTTPSAARQPLTARPEHGGEEASGQTGTPTRQPTIQPASYPAIQPTSPPAIQPSRLRRLTTGGCCTQPFWSSDSQRVLFIDKPASDAPVGIWGVDATEPAPTPELVTGRIGFYTADMAFVVELDRGTTTIERLADGAHWVVPAGGRPVSISPGRTRIAWQVSNEDLPFERRTTQVWVASLDGTNARSVANLPRGGLSSWVSDDVLLLGARESLQSREQILYTLSLADGRTVELVRSERLRGELLSPDGRWLAYYIALSDEPAENGLWLVRTDGTERRQLDRDLFGAYQWRDASRLLITPFWPEAAFHELWELNVETGEVRRLTDPAITPFKIANGDWQVSPDGRHVAFVESRDRNIWVLDLD